MLPPPDLLLRRLELKVELLTLVSKRSSTIGFFWQQLRTCHSAFHGSLRSVMPLATLSNVDLISTKYHVVVASPKNEFY